MRNQTKEKIREGKAVVGTIITLDDPSITGIMGKSGFDFFLIDTQHTPIGPDCLRRMITGLGDERDIIVRTLWNDPALVNQVLDIGADGVIIPLTNTAEQVERAVAATKYPPDGTRSWGPRGAPRYGGPERYAQVANEETLVWPQIETIQAVENIDEILKVEGVDGIMIGPADLGLSVGVPAPYSADPKVEEMIAHILCKCKEHGVPWGMFTSTFEIAERWLTRGGLIATVGTDVGFLSAGLACAMADVTGLLSRLEAKA